MMQQTHRYMPKWVTHRRQLQTKAWQRVCGTIHRYGVLIHGGTIPISKVSTYTYGTWIVAYGYWNGRELEVMFLARLFHDTRTKNGYEQTHYCADRFAISSGEKHPDLDLELGQEEVQSWVFITGYNPFSMYTPHKNAQCNRVLRQKIIASGCRFWEGWGIPHCSFWDPEASFLVLGIDEESALLWKQEYNQNAVVFGAMGTAALFL